MGPNPSGLCMCGCGRKTNLARNNVGGNVIRTPQRYCLNHHNRSAPVDYLVDEATGCWVWQLSRHPSGYPGGYAHRRYYESVYGPVPEGLQLDHLCRNRACVNPGHLEPVTNAENTRRGARAKLNPAAVEDIRSSGLSQRELAEKYGVSQSCISRAKSGKRWQPVEDWRAA